MNQLNKQKSPKHVEMFGSSESAAGCFLSVCESLCVLEIRGFFASQIGRFSITYMSLRNT